MQESPFETLQSEKKTSGRFTIVSDRVCVNGHEQNYDYLEIREGVSILPMVGEDILVQRQYRYPVASWQWELPGGFIDNGEEPVDAAIRELKEETGYTPLGIQQIESLGTFYPSFGSTNETIHLFAMHCTDTPGASEREAGEVIHLHRISREDFRLMVADGRFMHGAGLAAWARYISKR